MRLARSLSVKTMLGTVEELRPLLQHIRDELSLSTKGQIQELGFTKLDSIQVKQRKRGYPQRDQRALAEFVRPRVQKTAWQKGGGPEMLTDESERVRKGGQCFGIPSRLANGEGLIIEQLMSKESNKRT